MKTDLVNLSQVCIMTTGKLNSNAAVENGEYPFFTCAQETYRINKYAFDTEAVLLGGNNANGVFPLKYYKGKFNAYQRTYIMESIDKNVLLTRYLYYALKPALTHFQSASIGAATQYLTKSILDNFKIRLHSIEVQRKIINYVSNYDDLIENNLKRIHLLEKLIHLVFKEWFVQLRYPGHENKSMVAGVPEGWEKVNVPDLIQINPRTSVPKDKINKYVDMAALSEESMVIKEFKEKNGNSGSKFKNGDTLFARITPSLENGKTGFVNFLAENETAIGSTEFIVLRPKSVSAEFVYCLARTYNFREKAIKSMVGSSGRQRVQVSCFDDYSLLKPPNTVLDMFNSFAKPIFNEIRVLTQQNHKLQQARDLLLPKLMNGEIKV
ncbi:restriction endonuclease subunit S [Bacillus pumilus]|uniref:restriction endonuclease subunit S n=1 Tax=Bacillus pumilus TaxID=1408 RepID=UPI003917380C